MDLKKVGILAAIVVIVIIIAATIIIIPSLGEENVTITITSTDSYGSKYNSDISYSYYVNGIVHSSNQFSDLESYSVKATYFDGNIVVKTGEGFISSYDGKNEIFTSINLETPLNVTDVQIEIFNKEGQIVGSQKATFTMGDMTPI